MGKIYYEISSFKPFDRKNPSRWEIIFTSYTLKEAKELFKSLNGIKNEKIVLRKVQNLESNK